MAFLSFYIKTYQKACHGQGTADMRLSLSNFSVFSSFCHFVILIRSFCLSVISGHRRSSKCILVHIRSLRVNLYQSQACLVHSELYVGRTDGMGLGWMVIIGLLRAPLVLIKIQIQVYTYLFKSDCVCVWQIQIHYLHKLVYLWLSIHFGHLIRLI